MDLVSPGSWNQCPADVREDCTLNNTVLMDFPSQHLSSNSVTPFPNCVSGDLEASRGLDVYTVRGYRFRGLEVRGLKVRDLQV